MNYPPGISVLFQYPIMRDIEHFIIIVIPSVSAIDQPDYPISRTAKHLHVTRLRIIRIVHKLCSLFRRGSEQ